MNFSMQNTREKLNTRLHVKSETNICASVRILIQQRLKLKMFNENSILNTLGQNLTFSFKVFSITTKL